MDKIKQLKPNAPLMVHRSLNFDFVNLNVDVSNIIWFSLVDPVQCIRISLQMNLKNYG